MRKGMQVFLEFLDFDVVGHLAIQHPEIVLT